MTCPGFAPALLDSFLTTTFSRVRKKRVILLTFADGRAYPFVRWLKAYQT
jgi:hypothetical protein